MQLDCPEDLDFPVQMVQTVTQAFLELLVLAELRDSLERPERLAVSDCQEHQGRLDLLVLLVALERQVPPVLLEMLDP